MRGIAEKKNTGVVFCAVDRHPLLVPVRDVTAGRTGVGRVGHKRFPVRSRVDHLGVFGATERQAGHVGAQALNRVVAGFGVERETPFHPHDVRPGPFEEGVPGPDRDLRRPAAARRDVVQFDRPPASHDPLAGVVPDDRTKPDAASIAEGLTPELLRAPPAPLGGHLRPSGEFFGLARPPLQAVDPLDVSGTVAEVPFEVRRRHRVFALGDGDRRAGRRGRQQEGRSDHEENDQESLMKTSRRSLYDHVSEAITHPRDESA